MYTYICIYIYVCVCANMHTELTRCKVSPDATPADIYSTPLPSLLKA